MCAALLAGLGSSAAAAADIDPEADRILRSMTSHVAGLKQFSLTAENTIEAVTEDGQKIQFTAPASMTVSRPDRFFAERRGDVVDQAFHYDGKSLTLYNPGTKHYATVPAPGTIDETFDFAREDLDIIAPGSDLIDTRSYERLMQDVTSGSYIGVAVVGGHRCHHLAYRAGVVDWQLWVREGDQPIPCKYVITTTDVVGAPQFTVNVLDWNSDPEISPAMFEFVPPADASAVEFLSATTQDTP